MNKQLEGLVKVENAAIENYRERPQYNAQNKERRRVALEQAMEGALKAGSDMDRVTKAVVRGRTAASMRRVY